MRQWLRKMSMITSIKHRDKCAVQEDKLVPQHLAPSPPRRCLTSAQSPVSLLGGLQSSFVSWRNCEANST